MRRCYALVVVALLAAPATAQEPQALFKQKLLADGDTSRDVRSMLRSGRAFVEPHPAFADVTKSSNLRVVMRNQRLYRATVKVNDAHNLVVRVPVFAAGDALCCPSRARDRTYAWVAATKQMRRVSIVEFPLT